MIYDAEHFFDGYKADSAYALETLQAAIRGGAETVVLCDTNGGTLPWEVERIIRELKPALNHPFGIHTHNDSECGVINSLIGVREGAMQVQGTINGVGERCGNANLVSIMADLELKMGYQCLPEGKYPAICMNSPISSRRLPTSRLMNICPLWASPLLRIKAASMLRRCGVLPNPINMWNLRQIGNKMRVVVSDLSGRGNLLSKAEEHGVEVEGEEVLPVLNEIKELEVARLFIRSRGSFCHHDVEATGIWLQASV